MEILYGPVISPDSVFLFSKIWDEKTDFTFLASSSGYISISWGKD
jgi:hypothetical protein